MKNNKKPMSFDELCKKVKSAVVAGIFIFILIILAILALAGGLAVVLLIKSDDLVLSCFILAVPVLLFFGIFPTVTAYVILYKIVLREYPNQRDYFNAEIYHFLETDKNHLIHGLDSLRLILAQQKAKREPNIGIDVDRQNQDFI